MRITISRNVGFSLSAALLVAACGTAPMIVQDVPTAQPRQPQATETVATAAATQLAPTATANIEPRERLQLAITHLETGNVEQATVELREYQAQVPNSPQATRLLRHIEAPITEIFPAENFTVELMQGQTLGNLAATYLGDVLNFYALARYNNITNARTVPAGAQIRIPATEGALAARDAGPAPDAAATETAAAIDTGPVPTPAEAAAASAAGDAWPSIRAHVAARRFAEAIAEAEDSRVNPNAEQAAVLASAYDANARATRGTNATQAAAHAFRAGQLYLQTANRPEQAIGSLSLATELDPANANAQTMLATARTQTADSYYRTGVAAFQRQDLDGAIAAYDRVLEIDPTHQNAQVNRLQAIQLRENLQRLQ